MVSQLFTFFNQRLLIYDHEQKNVWTAFFLFFVIYCTGSIYDASVISLYLSQFEATTLPAMYLAMNVFSTLVSLVYLRWSKSYSPQTLIFISIPFLGALCLVTGFVLVKFPQIVWVYGFAFLWMDLYFIIPLMLLWGHLNQLFDIRQIKRLSGILGSGRNFSGIVLILLIPFLVGTLGSQLIPILAAAGFALQVPLFWSLFEKNPRKLKSSIKSNHAGFYEKISLRHFLKSKYLFWVALFASGNNLILYFLDFPFLTVLKQTYSTDQLTTYLSLFLSGTKILKWIFGFVLVAPVLKHWGLMGCLIILPGLLFLIGSGGILLPVVSTVWIVILLKGIGSTVNVFFDSALQMAYQAVPENRRQLTITSVEGVVKALASVISCLILMGLTTIWSEQTLAQGLIYAVVGLSALWAITGCQLYKEYIQMLNHSLNTDLNTAPYSLNQPKASKKQVQSISQLHAQIDHACLYCFYLFNYLDFLESSSYPNILEKDFSQVLHIQQQTIFDLFYQLDSSENWRKFSLNLKNEDPEQFAKLLELIDHQIPRKWKKKILPLIDNSPLSQKAKIGKSLYALPNISPATCLHDFVTLKDPLLRQIAVEALFFSIHSNGKR